MAYGVFDHFLVRMTYTANVSGMIRNLDEAQAKLAETQRQAQALALGMAVAGTAMSTMTAGVIQTGIEWSEQSNRIRAVIYQQGQVWDWNTKQVNAYTDALLNQARVLGSLTTKTPMNVIGGTGVLLRAGWDPKSVYDAIPSILDLAIAGGDKFTTEMATTFMLQVRNAYGDLYSPEHIANLAARVWTQSRLELNELPKAMEKVVGISAALNMPLEELLAVQAALRNMGMAPERGSTLMRGAETLLARTPSDRQAEAFKRLNLEEEQVYDMLVSGNFLEIIRELHRRKATPKDYADLFGVRRMEVPVNISAQMGPEFEKQLQDLYNTTAETGEVEEVRKIVEGHLYGAVMRVKSAWQELNIAAIEGEFGKSVTQISEGLAAILRTMGKMDSMVLLFSGMASAGPTLLLLSGLAQAYAAILFVQIQRKKTEVDLIELQGAQLAFASAEEAKDRAKVAALQYEWNLEHTIHTNRIRMELISEKINAAKFKQQQAMLGIQITTNRHMREMMMMQLRMQAATMDLRTRPGRRVSSLLKEFQAKEDLWASEDVLMMSRVQQPYMSKKERAEMKRLRKETGMASLKLREHKATMRSGQIPYAYFTPNIIRERSETADDYLRAQDRMRRRQADLDRASMGRPREPSMRGFGMLGPAQNPFMQMRSGIGRFFGFALTRFLPLGFTAWMVHDLLKATGIFGGQKNVFDDIGEVRNINTQPASQLQQYNHAPGNIVEIGNITIESVSGDPREQARLFLQSVETATADIDDRRP